MKNKKKKKGKKAFDLEAFERELNEGADVGTPVGAGSDDEGAGAGVEDVANEDAPNDGLFGEGNEDVGTGEEKSKAQKAAEKKAWLQEPDRDYRYDEVRSSHFGRWGRSG